jgi:hypothetical protein
VKALDAVQRALPRVALLFGLLAVPFAVMSTVNAGSQVTIEAPSAKKMGMGLVLLVSLQRAQ